MIKRLRIKFVCAIMAVSVVLLGVILGVVLHFSCQNMEMQSLNMMRSMADGPITLGEHRDSGEKQMFFRVQLSARGELVASSDSGQSSAYLQQIVTQAMSSQKESGKLEEYALRYLKSPSPQGISIIFADTTAETAMLWKLCISCVLIFLAGAALFFGIGVLLSHWFIRPVEKAWDQQRQFVADASHELKTPLSVIMANAELMQNEDLSQEERRTFGQNVLQMTYQMRSLVESMLEMARVDNGTVQMHFDSVDFSQLAEDAALSFQLLYEERGMWLERRMEEQIRVRGSEQHLYQVLDVLLDNALKYSTSHSTVRITLEKTGRFCLLSVFSPGQPLSREELGSIFKRFYRADRARTMNGSYGLGLSIAQSVLHAHRGKIWAESCPEGNVFRVQLPLLTGEKIG